PPLAPNALVITPTVLQEVDLTVPQAEQRNRLFQSFQSLTSRESLSLVLSGPYDPSKGETKPVQTAQEAVEADPRQPVLYLRSFESDRKWQRIRFPEHPWARKALDVEFRR